MFQRVLLLSTVVFNNLIEILILLLNILYKVILTLGVIWLNILFLLLLGLVVLVMLVYQLSHWVRSGFKFLLFFRILHLYHAKNYIFILLKILIQLNYFEINLFLKCKIINLEAFLTKIAKSLNKLCKNKLKKWNRSYCNCSN